MREIPVAEIEQTVRDLFIEANLYLNDDVIEALRRALEREESPVGREVLEELLENARLARQEGMPICQDTGLAVVFLEVGQEVHFVGGDLREAVQEGVRRAYREGYLRKSVCHCFSRKNTGDNTPAVIHTEVVPGDRVRVVAMPKGGGSENMSGVAMLTPAAGLEGAKEFVLQRVRAAGSNPCPPIIVGVGIGGSMEQAALLAKKALLRPLGDPSPDPDVRAMEEELLERINSSGIGPQGYGGRVTALAVHGEMMPCHIASLPVAVNIQCHAHRHKERVI